MRFAVSTSWFLCCFSLIGCGDDLALDGEDDSGPDGSAETVDSSVDGGSGSDVSAHEKAPIVWVGDVADSDVKIALAVDGNNVGSLFFCGGDETYEETTRWFRGEMPSGIENSVDSDGGWSAAFTIEASRVNGTLTSPDGDALDFTARTVRHDTLAGLYEGRGPCGLVGLIVDQPSADDTPSAQGVCLDADGVAEQVTPIKPLELDEEGGIVVTVGSSTEELSLLPVVPRL